MAASGAVIDGQPSASYARARLAGMVFRAKLRRLEFETRQGKLIEAAIVAVPDKLAPEVTALPDQLPIRDALKRELHALLKAVHFAIQYVRSENPDAGGGRCPAAARHYGFAVGRRARRVAHRRAPYQREIMDSLSPSHPSEQVQPRAPPPRGAYLNAYGYPG